MVHFVGAGSGAADLITVRGKRLLEEADVIIYAGSLVNPELLSYARKDCEIHNSAKMTLEEVISVIQKAEAAGKTTVRLHTGDSSIYGAAREHFAARRPRFARSIRSRTSARRSSSQEPRAKRPCPNANPSALLPPIRRQWCSSSARL